MMSVEDTDCLGCAGGYRHEHGRGAVCPHETSGGDWRGCCADYAAEQLPIVEALFAARRGRGPNSPRWLTDPVGHVWYGDPPPPDVA